MTRVPLRHCWVGLALASAGQAAMQPGWCHNHALRMPLRKAVCTAPRLSRVPQTRPGTKQRQQLPGVLVRACQGLSSEAWARLQTWRGCAQLPNSS